MLSCIKDRIGYNMSYLNQENKMIDMTGEKYGKLTVIKLASIDKGGNTKWACECECGGETVSYRQNLKKGKATSCGCFQKENMSKIKTTHGQSAGGRVSSTYKTWDSIKGRCTNTEHNQYSDYGGRGITVCTRWLESFDNFLEDMGERPSGMSIDRIDNNSGYSKENCRWTTSKQQIDNRRNTFVFVINGVEYDSSSKAEKELGLYRGAVNDRCRRGHAGYERKLKYGGDE